MINNIVYISAAKKDFSRDDLKGLLDKSRRRNARNAITGFLMYNDHQFFQVLEGAAENINNCYNRICSDNRHSSVITLHKGTSVDRLFGDWAMGMVEVANLSPDTKSDFINLCKLHKYKTASELHRDPVISLFAENFLSCIAKIRN